MSNGLLSNVMMMKAQYKIFIALSVSVLFSSPAFAQWYENRDSVIVRPWGEVMKASESVGSTRTVFEKDIEKAAMSDLRRRLTALIPGLEIKQNAGIIDPTSISDIGFSSSTASVFSRNSYGLVFIVDDLFVPYDQLNLDPCQIESVTLLNDIVDKALYGPLASNGAIYVTTKKGGYDKPSTFSFDFETGIGQAGIWPEYVGGEDYAMMNNDARLSSGYEALFSDEYIAGLGKKDPYDTYTPNVDYRSLIFRDIKPIVRFGTNAQGGNGRTKYNASISGMNDQCLTKVGPTNDFSRINMNLSVSTKFNRFLEASVNMYAMLGFRRTPTGYSFSTCNNSVPAVAFPLNLESVKEEGKVIPTYAVSQLYGSNPYATLLECGDAMIKRRTGIASMTLDADLSFIVPGLKSRTFGSIGSNYYIKSGQSNDYFALYWVSGTPQEELLRSGHVYRKSSSRSNQGTDSYQNWTVYERLTYDFAQGRSKFNSSLTYYMSDTDRSNNSYLERLQNITATARYSFDGKYTAELVLNYAGSSRFSKENRFAFLPAIALSWRPNDKIRAHAQAGLLGTDVFGTPYLYSANYSFASSGYKAGQATSNPWFGVTTSKSYPRTTVTRMENPNLKMPRIFQVDLGAEARIRDLNVELNLYRIKNLGMITETNGKYPLLTGISDLAFYENYNQTVALGAELNVSYMKTFGDFRVGAGAWAIFEKAYNVRVSNDFPVYDWMKVTGSETDSYRGYTCLGKFSSQEEIAAGPTIGTDTRIGDLKYADLNGDGEINTYDQSVIGHTEPDLKYAFSMNLGWKGFDLSVTGTGRAFYQIALNGYFKDGYGDTNYSKFMLENQGGQYPRLCYLKSVDNSASSQFWLRDGGWFKVKDLELGYTWKFGAKAALKSLRLSLRGSNLLTITNIEYVDPESIDSGVSTEPLFSLYTASLKFNF